jgi:hypothetical protein
MGDLRSGQTGSDRFRTGLASILLRTARVLSCVALIASTMAFLAPYSQAAEATKVSLTFDNGNRSQYTLGYLQALQPHGATATFFVKSGTISEDSGFMTWAQLGMLAGAGNDIGGKSVNATNLTTDPDPTAQVCNDRQTLVQNGLTPVAFAYPSGAQDATVQDIVQRCGYGSARTAGGLSPTGPRYAETLPLANSLATRAWAPQGQVALADMRSLVNGAAANGGGWSQIVIQSVCSQTFHPAHYNTCTSKPGWIELDDLNAFLDWIQNSGQDGGAPGDTILDTVRDVTTSPLPSSDPPPSAGYFTTTAVVGTWDTLPSDMSCASQVHRSTWEPRPTNFVQNHTMPDASAVHVSFAARPRSVSYDPRWNSWLLPRVDGQFTGTTDEIIQWAACKWGLPDNVLRAVANQESTWFQYLHNAADNRCVVLYGCGDLFPAVSSDRTLYCNGIAAYGYDYQQQFGAGLCPKTFSIVGVMSWDAPAWEAPAPPYPGNQNGTFPFNRDSTAFALDYYGSYLRGCYNGWISWLPSTGDLWGCVGSWYSGAWLDSGARNYIAGVQEAEANTIWLTPGFYAEQNQHCPAGWTCG